MTTYNYEVITNEKSLPVKSWTRGVAFEDEAKKQLLNVASLPFIHSHIAVMPDVHVGKGATIGSVIPTIGAIIPAAVGVDIGCGMIAVKTSLTASDLPENLKALRTSIEASVPHGFAPKQTRDNGAWGYPPDLVQQSWANLNPDFEKLLEKYPRFKNTNNINHLGTLGSGNHFIEICLDEMQNVWIMLHSGSRGVGNAIGTHFIELAKKEMERWMIQLPDRDLAYLPEGSEYFSDYIHAVSWAQSFAKANREIMMQHVLIALAKHINKPFSSDLMAVNCHHNYVNKEHHYGENVWVTRKGAVSAKKGELGIIPGSMGAKSFIVRGLGNEESFCSCSHGAGRIMSRTKAKSLVSLDQHKTALEGVECRTDAGTIDETPAAYKPIDAVMEAQKDLVEIVHTLKQVLCVKG